MVENSAINDFLGDTVSGERLCCGLSLFESMMKELQKTLNEDKDWKGIKPPTNGCMYIEESAEFHRIWSACQWVMAHPTGQNEFTSEYMFGDGLNFAGMTIIYLLRQDSRFNLLDFSYHFLKVHLNDPKALESQVSASKESGNVQVEKLRTFIERIKKIQRYKFNRVQSEG